MGNEAAYLARFNDRLAGERRGKSFDVVSLTAGMPLATATVTQYGHFFATYQLYCVGEADEVFEQLKAILQEDTGEWG